jgi:hypothetical protein
MACLPILAAIYAVMAGLVPAIHVFAARKAWMPATNAGMTNKKAIALYAFASAAIA